MTTTDQVPEGKVNRYSTPARTVADITAQLANLIEWATLNPTTLGGQLVLAAAAADVRALIGTVIGSDVQAYNANLAALAALSGTDVVPYRSGLGWTTTGFSTFGRGLAGAASAATARAALIVGQVTDVPHASSVYTIALTDDPMQTVTLTANWGAPKTITTSGSKSEGQRLHVVLGSHATLTRALTWNAIFVAASGLTLPAATAIAKKTWCEFVWDDTDSKLVMVRASAVRA